MDNLILYDGAYNGPQIDAAISRALAGGAIDQQIGALQAAVGSPLEAATVAEMTNVNKVYVYTGSEAGYTAGHWYYWNGSAWSDGGVYNAVAVDMTLSDSSDNAVANRIIKAALDALQASADAAAELALASFPHATASGPVASFEDGADNIPVRSLAAQIAPVQAAGTPSPENPLPISGWTEAKIFRCAAEVDTQITWQSGYINERGQDKTGGAFRRTVGFLASEQGDIVAINVAATTEGKIRVCEYGSTQTFVRVAYESPAALLVGETANVCVALSNDAAYYRVSVPSTFGATVKQYHNGEVYTVTFPASAGTVYGGTIADNGNNTWAIKSKPYFASYNGEALAGPWVSSMDVYAEGVTPTTGAQVVDLGGVETEYTISADSVTTLLGTNNIFADAGDVSVDYRADTTRFVETRLPSTLGAPLLFSPVPVLTDEAEPEAEPDAEQEAESDE